MNKLRYYILVILTYALHSNSMGQDLVFSQYYSNPIHFNSAFVGTVAYPRFAANYRMQWPGLNNVYESYAASYDQYFPSKNLSAGLILLSDDQGNGTLKQTSAKAIVSYNIRFGDKWQIKFGVGSKFAQNRLDWDKLIFFDQLDPITGPLDGAGVPNISSELRPTSLSQSYFDVDLGMLLYNPKYFLGISVFHANGPAYGFVNDETGGTNSSLPLLISLHGGYQLTLEKDNKGNPSTFISPSILFASQSGFNQLNVGAYLQKSSVFGGLWVRHTIENLDALIFSFGVIANNIKVGYSYDLTLSSLENRSTAGSHEIGISVGLKRFEKKVSKMNDCFSLFR